MSSTFKTLSRCVSQSTPDRLYAAYVNMRNGLKGYPHRVSFKNDGQWIRVTDGQGEIHVCRSNRLWLYKKSIATRTANLAKAYILDKFVSGLHGSFIDCGANVGELGYFARAHGLDYHAFEPEPLEADCCDLNNFSGDRRTNRLALWKENTTLSFYSKPDTGDGSVFEIESFDGVTQVPAITLDSYIAERNITQIAVIKIEAEGAEPEILEGASKALEIAHYLTVDCGFERGLAKTSTVADVVNIAAKAGYGVVDWHPRRVSFLFRNLRFA